MRIAWLLMTLSWATPALGQTTRLSAPAPVASSPLPPLLYVKLIGPKGMKATFFRGTALGQTFDLPCTIGVRPGYGVRMALSGMPDHPNAFLFPTLEVRGSLLLAGKQRPADFPAALVFRTEDFARVQEDATLTKVVVLERPDSAVPIATRADEPFEIDVPSNRDPLRVAWERGQPLLVMRMGQRQLSRAELSNVPGTVLLPGEKVLAAPQFSPNVPWQCVPVIDPLAGPVSPGDFLCVSDGGDVGLPAGFDRQGKLRGLDPSDTVAEYFDSRGRQRLAISNRVCLCIPRFVVVKTETGIANHVSLSGPLAMNSTSGYAGTSRVQPSLEHSQNMQMENIQTRLKASGTEQSAGPAVTGRIGSLVVIATELNTRSIDAACLPGVPEPKDGPLIIIKWPDRFHALVGDIVTFTLKYSNSGGQPISHIVVSDSLTNRFEYIPGTAKTDREAHFTTQPNDAGSHVLRWEITGSLEPRETGMVTFQVRVR
jgi:uncharacterized repeat protein (TIGR01451 family)